MLALFAKRMAFSSRDTLVILIRGLAFRGGGRASQDPSAPLQVSSSPDEQILALRSLQQNVIAPARTLGWRVGLAIDVVMPSHLRSAWQQAKSASGLRAAVIEERIRETYRHRTQAENLVATLIWANQTGPAEWESRSAMLISRADLVFRKPLPLPPPPDEDGKLMLPFRSVYRKTNTTRCTHKWSDLIIYVPRRLELDFVDIVRSIASRQGENMHSIVADIKGGAPASTFRQWLDQHPGMIPPPNVPTILKTPNVRGRYGIPLAEVRAFAPEANAGPDSAFAYNPVYYIIGRNQSTTVVPPADCSAKANAAAAAAAAEALAARPPKGANTRLPAARAADFAAASLAKKVKVMAKAEAARDGAALGGAAINEKEARAEAKAEAKLEAKARSMDPAIAAAIRAKEARAKVKLLKGASKV